VNLLPHSIAQRGIHLLMAPHAWLALEGGRHDGGEEVPAIALHLEVLAGQTVRDVAAHVVCGGFGHGLHYRREGQWRTL